MRFFVPTDIYVEKDCVKNHAQNLLSVGMRALIMTGHKSAAVNGSLNDVTEVLDAGKAMYRVFNEVEENPSTDTLRKGCRPQGNSKPILSLASGEVPLSMPRKRWRYSS